MTLNGIIAHILRYFIKFDSFAGLLRHSGWRWTMMSANYNTVFQLYLAKA